MAKIGALSICSLLLSSALCITQSARRRVHADAEPANGSMSNISGTKGIHGMPPDERGGNRYVRPTATRHISTLPVPGGCR